MEVESNIVIGADPRVEASDVQAWMQHRPCIFIFFFLNLTEDGGKFKLTGDDRITSLIILHWKV